MVGRKLILIGCGVGALFAGALTEKFGRRFVLIACALLFAMVEIFKVIDEDVAATNNR